MPLFMIGIPLLLNQMVEPLGIEAFHGYAQSPQLVWFVEIVLIVGGHVLGVLAAHRTALRLSGSRAHAARSQVALTVLMTGFTVATLWLLSLPLVTTA